MTGIASLERMRRKIPVTVAMYHILGEQGVFGPDDRVELIDGEIYEMSPTGSLHSRCVKFLNAFFAAHFAGKLIVSVQDPIILDDRSEPEPDLALLRFREDFYKDELPQANDVVLVVEVADSTFEFDRTKKLPRYAAAGIPEFWLVDLEHDRVEVHFAPNGDLYSKAGLYIRGEKVASESIPNLSISVDELLG